MSRRVGESGIYESESLRVGESEKKILVSPALRFPGSPALRFTLLDRYFPGMALTLKHPQNFATAVRMVEGAAVSVQAT